MEQPPSYRTHQRKNEESVQPYEPLDEYIIDTSTGHIQTGRHSNLGNTKLGRTRLTSTRPIWAREMERLQNTSTKTNSDTHGVQSPTTINRSSRIQNRIRTTMGGGANSRRTMPRTTGKLHHRHHQRNQKLAKEQSRHYPHVRRQRSLSHHQLRNRKGISNMQPHRHHRINTHNSQQHSDVHSGNQKDRLYPHLRKPGPESKKMRAPRVFRRHTLRPPRSTLSSSSAASDVYKRQGYSRSFWFPECTSLCCWLLCVLMR